MKPVDIYILSQPEKYQSILLHLVAVVEATVPELTLEYKWKIPFFYYKKKPFCFLNASHKGRFVDIVFSKGYQMHQNAEFLNGDNRKLYKSLRYFSLEEINNKILISVLKEAKALS